MNPQVWVALISVAGSLGVALSAAIKMVYKRACDRNDQAVQRLESKLDDCEKRHDSANTELRKQAQQIGELKGFYEGLKAGQQAT
jgi:prefoldin subunit 5